MVNIAETHVTFDIFSTSLDNLASLPVMVMVMVSPFWLWSVNLSEPDDRITHCRSGGMQVEGPWEQVNYVFQAHTEFFLRALPPAIVGLHNNMSNSRLQERLSWSRPTNAGSTGNAVVSLAGS